MSTVGAGAAWYRKAGIASCLLAALALLALPAAAQLPPPNTRGVAMGHLHYLVADVAAERDFWVAIPSGEVVLRLIKEEVLP
jgi:hypothetical protein